MQITPKYNVTVFGSAQKGFKCWILNRFLLVNSEMWIRTAIKLPHDLGVCQKTVGNSAGDFHGGAERKTPTSWIRTAIKSRTTPCIWWKSLMSPWETITVRIGLKAQTPRSCGNLTAVWIHISEFTRRNRLKIQCLIPFWALPNTVTLYFGVIYILFLKCWKVFKRTILHDCSTTATGSRKRRKAHKLSNGSLLWQQQVCNTILKCVL